MTKGGQRGRPCLQPGSLFAALHRLRDGGTNQWKMADGVDHIDIYADVEEEFNQVFNMQPKRIFPGMLCSSFNDVFGGL